MKISIITPSYNQVQFIGKTIESILSQQYPNIEYIIMDGGSTDGTQEILKQYEVKIKKLQRSKNCNVRSFHWVSENDKGQVDAINKGLRMATGDIVTYINSDDYYTLGAIQNVMRIFRNRRNVDWITGDCIIVDENGHSIQNSIRIYKKFLRHFLLRTALFIVNPIAQPSTFWRKEMIVKAGYFDEELRYAFDYDFWIRLMKHSLPFVSNNVFSCFRIHKASKGGKEYVRQFAEEQRVAKRYTSNKLLLVLHRIHIMIIVFMYNIIKD